MQKYRFRTNWLNYFRPTSFMKSFSDINIFLLKKIGIKLIICDLDNTLAPHFSRLPTKKAISFCNDIKKHGLRLVIVSNNNKKRVKTYAEKLNVDGWIANAHKPFKNKITKCMLANNALANETIIVGDQFITDVWAANRIGCKSILVLPLINPRDDDSSSFLIKFLDRYVYRKLEHSNFLHLGHNEDGELGNEFNYI